MRDAAREPARRAARTLRKGGLDLTPGDKVQDGFGVFGLGVGSDGFSGLFRRMGWVWRSSVRWIFGIRSGDGLE